MVTKRYSLSTRNAITNLEKLREALKIQDMTTYDAAKLLNRSKRIGQEYMGKLYDDGEVHIGSWWHKAGSGGDYTAVYRLGSGVDAKKPKMPEQAKYRRYYAKLKKDPARYMNKLVRDKISNHRRNPPKRKAKPDPWTAWIPRKISNTGEQHGLENSNTGSIAGRDQGGHR